MEIRGKDFIHKILAADFVKENLKLSLIKKGFK
jgi:hypothetical protein